jgi:hypothetical protein
MGENDAFVAATRRVMELMKGIRFLVCEEKEYSQEKKPFPANREIRFLEKNRMLKKAMQELIASYQTVKKCCGERERNEALRIVELLREYFQETMRLVQEVHSSIQRVRDDTYREIRTMGLRKKALNAYCAYR